MRSFGLHGGGDNNIALNIAEGNLVLGNATLASVVISRGAQQVLAVAEKGEGRRGRGEYEKDRKKKKQNIIDKQTHTTRTHTHTHTHTTNIPAKAKNARSGEDTLAVHTQRGVDVVLGVISLELQIAETKEMV